MVKFYLYQIKHGEMELSDVPVKWRRKVKLAMEEQEGF